MNRFYMVISVMKLEVSSSFGLVRHSLLDSIAMYALEKIVKKPLQNCTS